MAKLCEMCDNKLSLFRRGKLCKECTEENYSEWSIIRNDIQSLENFSENKLMALRKFGKKPLFKLYSKLFQEYESDKELNDKEMENLERVRNGFGLTKDDVYYDDTVLPYVYVNQLRKTGELPVAKITIDTPINLKKDEVPHFATYASLGELKSVRVGYQPGSRGVSIRLMKGVSYRVGSHRGHVIKEDKIVEKSRGALIVSNKRLPLVPIHGNKQVSIPIEKISLYRCSENYLELYKEGREKPYFFSINPGAIEICGICLGELIKDNQ